MNQARQNNAKNVQVNERPIDEEYVEAVEFLRTRRGWPDALIESVSRDLLKQYYRQSRRG
jgi:hypothetical protein